MKIVLALLTVFVILSRFADAAIMKKVILTDATSKVTSLAIINHAHKPSETGCRLFRWISTWILYSYR